MVEVLLGGWHKDAASVITRLARQLASHTGKETGEQTKYLFQRLGILLMRGNSALIASSTEHQHMSKQKWMVTRISMDNLSLSSKHEILPVYLHIESTTCDIRNTLVQHKKLKVHSSTFNFRSYHIRPTDEFFKNISSFQTPYPKLSDIRSWYGCVAL